MSILENQLTKAQKLGIKPTQTITPKGMAYVLTIADRYGLINYKNGMNDDWLDSLKLWSHKHNQPLPTFQEILAATLDLSTEETTGFKMPSHFWNAIGKYKKTRYLQALNGKTVPELPPEWSGLDNHHDEQKYLKEFAKNAISTGNYQQATRLTRQTFGLPETPPKQITMTQMPKHLKQQLHNTMRRT